MTDEEIYNQVRAQYPNASNASLYQMVFEIQRNSMQNTSNTSGYVEALRGLGPSTANQKQTVNNPDAVTYEYQWNGFVFARLQNRSTLESTSNNTQPAYPPRWYSGTYSNQMPPFVPVPPAPSVSKPKQLEVAPSGKRSIKFEDEI